MAYRNESTPVLSAQFDHWHGFLMDHAAGRRAVAIVGGYRNLVQHSMVQLYRLRQSGADVLSLYSHNTPDSQGWGPDAFHAATASRYSDRPFRRRCLTGKHETSTGLVMGTARAADGTPLRRVRIRLSPGLEEMTDLCGFFAFFDCQPGAKMLELLQDDGTVVTSCSVTVTGGQVTRQDISILTNAAERSWAGFR